MNFRILTILIIIIVASIGLNAQSGVMKAQVLSELEKRGLTEAEASQALIENGYDIDNLDDLPPSEIPKVKAIMEELQATKAKEIKEEDAAKTEATNLNTMQATDAIKDTLIAEVEEIFEEEPVVKPDPVRIYGQELFRNKTIRVYQESQEIKAPDRYVIGPGDEIGVSIFGPSSLDEQYTVSKDGDIRINRGKMRVFLKGLTFADAKKKLFQRFRLYNNFNEGQFAVTLNYSRTIQVSVYGEVMNQGPITIPAINTAFSALVAVNGPNNIGSVRNIKLVKTNGEVKTIDVYKYIKNPEIAQDFYLDDGDIITVPVATNVVAITGAIQRSLKYELVNNEGLKELIAYAGGLKENAYQKTIQVKRYESDKLVIIDVPYADMANTNGNFSLQNGDVVEIKTIDDEIRNFVQLEGAFINAGQFERTNGMTLYDLVTLAGIKEEAKTDQVFIQRRNLDGTTFYLPVNLESILKNPKSTDNLVLENKDKITLYKKDRFVDSATFSVQGSVRNPAEFKFDVSQGIRVSEALNLSGGLRRDAANIAYLQRVDPLQETDPDYVALDLDAINNDPNSAQNLIIRPFDKLVIYSRDQLFESSKIAVSGAVNAPGDFVYGEGMTVKQALVLAQGVKLGAALNKIVVSRVVIQDNEPTKTIIANIEIDRNLNVISSDNGDFELMPFDAIMVRYVPEFELQEFITLNGEVKYPGRYPILGDNERISSIIARANGLTDEGFAEGATLYRAQDDIGNVVIKLDDILDDRKSRFNFTVRGGDVLTVPKQKEFVTIVGATKVKEILNDNVVGANNSITVPYHEGKNAKFYIDEYAGGINDEVSSGKYVYVELPNGQIKKSKYRFPFGRKYPKVTKGSKIRVTAAPIEIEKVKGESEEIDWTKVLGDTVAQATSVLTLILLARQLD